MDIADSQDVDVAARMTPGSASMSLLTNSAQASTGATGSTARASRSPAGSCARPTTSLPSPICSTPHTRRSPLPGMRFVASHQDVETTRRRVSAGDTIVAVVDGEVVGTITLASAERTGPAFYNRPDVMSVGQFAVKPSLQKHGIGSTLLDVAEQLAREHGAAYVALDTSEHAVDLIAFYEARGYQFVQHHRWAEVNYRSVIVAKALGAPASG